jgi:hypothetical protein
MVETVVLRRFLGGVAAPADTAAVLAALRRLTIEPGPDGAAGIYAGDGGEATIDVAALREAEGLSEAQIEIEVFSRGLAEIVFDLASAAGMTVAAAPGRRVLLTEGGQVRDLPEQLAPLAHTCVDGAELYWWLAREGAGDPATADEPSPRKEAVTRGDALRTLFGVFRRD